MLIPGLKLKFSKCELGGNNKLVAEGTGRVNTSLKQPAEQFSHNTGI